MFVNNAGAAQSAPQNLQSSSFSPFLESIALGSVDFSKRQLSPGMTFAGLGFTPGLPQSSLTVPTPGGFFLTPGLQSQSALVGSQAVPSRPEDVLESERTKHAGMLVASRLANFERIDRSASQKNGQQSKTSHNITSNMANYPQYHQQQAVSSSSLQSSEQNSLATGASGTNTGKAVGMGMGQHQQSNSQQVSGGYLNGPFFESPLMSNAAMLDYQGRQMSPPTSTSYLPLTLPETTNGNNKSFDNVTGPNLEKKLKQSAAVVSKLMDVERQAQSSKKRTDEVSPPSVVPPPRLFAPLEQGRSTSQGEDPLVRSLQHQNSQSSLGSSGANQMPGPMTNLLRSTRLSTGGGDDGYFDMSFANGDFPYTFSPQDVVRSLGGSSGVPESPLTQNLRMFPYSTGYNSLVPSSSWAGVSNSQYPSMPSLATPAFPTRSADQVPQQQQQRPGTSSAKRSSMSKRRSGDDSDEGEQVKKKKKPAKPVDPNEPKITSKHRGVCWYKRTKKWVVQTKVNGKRVHVGYFDDEEKAAEAYKNAVQGIQVKKALEAKQRSMDEAAARASKQQEQMERGSMPL